MSFNAGSVEATLVLNRDPFQQGLELAKREAERFQRERFEARLDADDSQVTRKVQSAEDSARRFARTSATATLDVDSLRLQQKITKAQAQLDALRRDKAAPKIDLDIAAAELKREQIARQIEELAKKRVTPKVDADTASALLKLAETQRRIEELEAKKASASVDLDISAAEAQLAALQAQLASIGDVEVGVDVDSAPIDAATESLSGMVGMVDAVAAAWPPVSTAILAVPGALELIAVPMLAVAAGMDGIAASAVGLIGPFQQLQSAVSATFTSGLTPAVKNLSALMPVLQSGLVGTASALSQVASRVTAVASSASGLQEVQAVFAGVNRIVVSLAPGIATMTSNLLKLSTSGLAGLQPLGAVLEEVGQRWSSVIDSLNQSGTAQAAIQSLVSALGGVLDILPGLVQAGAQVMAVLGPPLATALKAVADVVGFLAGPMGSVTTAALAMAAAWKAASVAGAALALLGGKIGAGWAAASAGIAAGAGRATTAAAGTQMALFGAAGASDRAAASGGKVASAFSKVGNALPIVAVAAAAAAYAFDNLSDKSDDMATSLLSGSMSLAQASSQIKEHNDDLAGWTTVLPFLKEDMSDVRSEMESQIATMDPLSAAQARVQVAQLELNDAMANNPPASEAVRAAQERLTVANQNLAKAQADAKLQATNVGAAFGAAVTHFQGAAGAQDDAARSAKLLADAYTLLIDPFTSVSDKAAAFANVFADAVEPAVTQAEALRGVNDAFRELGDSITPAAAKLINLDGTINTTTAAGSQLQQNILAVGQAMGQNAAATIAVEKSTRGVTVATGDAAAAFENQKQKLVELLMKQGASETAARALANTYMTFPAQVSTTFTQPGMVKAIADSLGLSQSIVGIPNDKSVVVNSLTDTARKQLEDLGLTVKTLPNGQIIITAETGAASSAIITTVALANGQTGVITVDANNQPADGKITSTVQFADGSKGTITFDGNNIPANGKVNATVTYADGRTGTIQITARDAGAMSTAQIIAASISKIQAVIPIVTRPVTTPAGGGVMGYAGGGLFGATTVHASRGYVLPGYEPGVDSIPAVLSKGEAVLVPELVRMLGAGRILAANAEASGGRPAANVGNLAAIMDGTLQRAPQLTAKNLRVDTPRFASATPRTVPGRDPALLAALERLEAAMKARSKGSGAHVEVNVEAAVGETADEVSRSLRRLGSLGLFGD